MQPDYQAKSTVPQSDARSATLARHATWTLLLGALAAMIACCWLVDFDRILRRTADDAYYYFEIAENVANGHGATFDGIHKTSGFQPLWLLCLAPVFWLCPNEPETAVRIGLSLQAVFLFAAGALIVSVLPRAFPWKTVLGVIVCYTFSVFVLGVNGMETPVVILSLAALFAYGWHAKVFDADRPSIFKQFSFGVLLGLVMLARLDMVFLGGVIMAFWGVSALKTPRQRVQNLTGAAIAFAGASLTVAPYLIYNYVTFGTASPISGALKSNFPHIMLTDSTKALYYCIGLPKLALIGAILVFAILYAGWYLTAAKSARDARFYFHTSMAVLACAIMLHALHEILFMKWAIWTWHFFPYFLFASLAIAAPLEKLISTRLGGAAYWWATAALVIAGTLGYGLRMTVSGRESTWQTASYDAALWARTHTDPADVFALKDTGNFGYFSQRRVINLDGVVNNLEFQEAVKAGKLQNYFHQNHVKYLVLHATKDEHPAAFDGTYTSEPVKYRSNLYGVWSDPITLHKRNEIYRATYEYWQKDDFVIWDVSSLTASP
jgi:hypothetical protein